MTGERVQTLMLLGGTAVLALLLVIGQRALVAQERAQATAVLERLVVDHGCP